MSEKFDDLSQRVLEGEATAGERAQLATLIARDAALEGRHEEMKQAFGLLAEARPEDPPAGIPAAVLREIEEARGADRVRLEPAPRRIRPSFRPDWLRYALPAAAALVAVALLWIVREQSTSDRTPDQVTGTMTQVSPPALLRLGDGAGAATARGEVVPDGFLLTIQAGSDRLHVDIRARDLAVRLASSRAVLDRGGRTWQGELPEHSSILVHGVAPSATVSLVVQVRFRDGRASSGELRITGPRPLTPNGVPEPEPTSRPPEGH